jgi:hypothetical protein
MSKKLTAKEVWALRRRGLRLPTDIKQYSSAKLAGIARRFNRALDEADSMDKMIKEMADDETRWYGIRCGVGTTMVTCLEDGCPHKFTCANHLTAGDFRTEGGLTPNLKIIGLNWCCDRMPKDNDGARLLNGNCVGLEL